MTPLSASFSKEYGPIRERKRWESDGAKSGERGGCEITTHVGNVFPVSFFDLWKEDEGIVGYIPSK